MIKKAFHIFFIRKGQVVLPTAFLLFIFFSLCAISTYSNYLIDSLNNRLNHRVESKEKIKMALQLSEEFYKPNPALSLEYANESERLAQELKSDSLLNKAYVNRATAYLHLGNYPMALEYYYKAIEGAQKLGDSPTLFTAYEYLGILFYYQGDRKNALNYFFEALNQFSKRKAKNQLVRKAYLLNNIGILFDETQEFQQAEYYFNQGLVLAKQLSDEELVANILNNQGTLYRDLGKNEKALQLYNEALEIRKKINNKWGLTRSYLSFGEFYFNRKDYSASEKYFKEAVKVGQEIKSWQSVSPASFYLFQLYKQTGDYRNALSAFELNKRVNDSLFNQERTRKFAQLEMKFELDKKQRLLEARHREKQLYYWIGAVALGLSVVIVSLLLVLQRNKVRRARLEKTNLELEKVSLEKDIEQKDKELTTSIMHLMQKNELIDDISLKLQEIEMGLNDDAQLAVQKLKSDVQSNLQPDLLDEFEFRFQQVHDEFYKELNDRFPDLTPNERRLCAFLKLHMTTKEISAITHQNAKSIDVARTRLRKKLKLTGTDQNLVSFLEQLGS